MIKEGEGIKHSAVADIEIVSNENKTIDELEEISKKYNEEQERLFFEKYNSKKEGE